MLHYCSCNYSLEDIADELLVKNVKINEKNRMGLTPLMVAADRGNLTMIRKLIQSNCDINTVGRNGSTAVMLSVRRYLVYDTTDQAMKCLQYLIDANADVNIVDENGDNALMQYPQCWGRQTKKVMVSLINHGCDINHINNVENFGVC